MSIPRSSGRLLVLFSAAVAAGCGQVELPTAAPERATPAAAPEVRDYTLITDCGTVISQPGKYRLEKDVSCDQVVNDPFSGPWISSALTIAANHVVVDLIRHHISTQPSAGPGGVARGDISWGIMVRGSADVTIRGPGFVEQFMSSGIVLESSTRVTITKVIVRANVDYGLHIRNSSEVTIHDNTIHGTETMLPMQMPSTADVVAFGSSSLHLLYNHMGTASGQASDYGISLGGNGMEVRGNLVQGAFFGLALEEMAEPSTRIRSMGFPLRSGFVAMGIGSWPISLRTTGGCWLQPTALLAISWIRAGAAPTSIRGIGLPWPCRRAFRCPASSRSPSGSG
ncbi:MAG: right-handed parallel beta-helix repeat-containing protein [Gemmatimonadota bacterium]